MPQIGNDSNPVVFKNKKKGNRKLINRSSRMTAQERKTYNKNFDRIFGNPQKNFNRQKG